MFKRAYGSPHVFGLEKRGFGVAAHYFMCHYTDRLLRHENLAGMCCAAGEHVQQPHSSNMQERTIVSGVQICCGPGGLHARF